MVFPLFADAVPLIADVDPSQSIPAGDLGATFAKMMCTFGILILLLFGTYWLIKKMIQMRLQRGVGTATIQVLEKRMVSPKTMLYLIEVDNKKILLAESQLEIKRLETFENERVSTNQSSVPS